MFTSKLSSLIDDAVMDCITFGRGTASRHTNGTTVEVIAEWAENETDIEITIRENFIIRFTFTERVPEEYR
jgi:hypothetical protein